MNVQASYSLFEQDLIGEENIIGLDPLFFDSNGQNFTLQAESPCIDAGTFNVFDEVILEYYGQAPDIGAFEYYPVLGDVNGDLEISILDIIIIIEIIIEDYNPSNQEYMLSDFNQDSFIDILDIIQLVNFILE